MAGRGHYPGVKLRQTGGAPAAHKPCWEVIEIGRQVGRPHKIRLPWYQEEPDFWDDPRFRSVRNLYGYLSFVIYKSLHDMMFLTNGYYLNYQTERERADVIHWLQQRLVGPGLPQAEKIGNVIDELVACGFFDGDLYRRGVITSRWAQTCYYRGTTKRKDVCFDLDLWLLNRQDMESISKNSSILSFFISDGRNSNTDVNNPVSDGRNQERRGKEIRGEDITLDNIRSDGEGEDTPFLSLYREKFCSVFGREPGASHLKTVGNLKTGGKAAELILEALESLRGKAVRDAEPYAYRTILHYVPKQTASRDDPTRPLEQWEQDWLEEIERRKRRDKEASS
ncbi:MAG: DUF4373 domain-containing protein [Clostridiaceae bacterium]|nr:DUF4373 domain-containing protein [Clostridiaceae bacterium]